MRYLGGKTRIAKHLAAEIDKVRRPGQWVWDAFCGGLSMTKALSVNGPVYSTDACVPLINMYRAVQAGWRVETEVPLELYRAAKALPDTDPMKAFCGFGCSFGGKWFGGYAAPFPTNRTPHGAALRAAIRDTEGAQLDVVDFLACAPSPLDGVLYLDPPYAGTTAYNGVAPFDSNVFHTKVRAWSEHCHVFVSEYAMPFGRQVWSRTERTTLGGKGAHGSATERLYFIAKGSL